MAAGEGTVPEAFGPTWEILPPDVRDAYEQALLVEHARAMLGVGAVFGASQGEPVTAEQLNGIGASMAGMHLSEARAVADTAEQLATQLGLAPYVREGQTATVHPFLADVSHEAEPAIPAAATQAADSAPEQSAPDATPVEAAVDPVVPTSAAPKPEPYQPRVETHPLPTASPEPEAEPAPTPAETAASEEVPESDPELIDESVLSEPEAPAAAEAEEIQPLEEPAPTPESDEQPVAEAKDHPIVRARKINSLRIIYGTDFKSVIESLDEAIIDGAIQELETIYLKAAKNRASAESRVAFWRAYNAGKSDGIIAAEFDSPSTSAVQVKRSQTLRGIGKIAPALIDLVHLVESKIPATPNSAATSENPEPEIVISRDNAPEVLKEELAVLADALGISGLERRQLRARLDEHNPDMKLTSEVRKALSAIATKYRRLNAKELVTFTKLEQGVFQKLTGTDPDDDSTYPISSVIGMMHEDLKTGNVTITQVLAGAFQKINKANSNASSTRA